MVRLSSITCVDYSEGDVTYRGDGLTYCELSGDELKVFVILGLVVLERGVDLKAPYPLTTLSREDEAKYYKIATELLNSKRDLAEIIALIGLQEVLQDQRLRYGLLWLILECYGLNLFPDRRMASRVRKTILKFLEAPSKQRVVKELFRRRSMLDVDDNALALVKKTVRTMLRELEKIV